MSPLITTKASASAQGYGFFSPTAIAGGNYYSIATATAGSNVASLTISSIPQTYTHLQLRGIVRDTRSAAQDSAWFQFNGDSSSNYTYHELYGNGSSILSDGGIFGAYSNFAAYCPSAGSTSGIFGAFVIDILDYTNTNKLKTVRMLSGFDANGSGSLSFMSNLWNSTSAITSIGMFGATSVSANLVTGTQMALYGVK